jgi:hypothetical protein
MKQKKLEIMLLEENMLLVKVIQQTGERREC